MQNIKKSNSAITLYDVLFFLLLTLTFYFIRNTLCSILMILFCGYTILNLIHRNTLGKFPFYFWGMLLFIAYGALHTALGYSINSSVSMTMVKSLSLNLIALFCIVQYILFANNVSKVLAIFEWSIFVNAVLITIQSIGTIFDGRLGSATEMNANMLAMLSVYGLVICSYFIKTDVSHIARNKAKIVLYVIIILLTGSRKGLLMLAVAYIIILFMNNRKRILRNIFIIATTAVVAYFMIINIPFLYSIIGVRVESLIELLVTDNTEEGSLSSRQSLIEVGMKYIERKPWVGYGYDCFKLVSGEKDPNTEYGYYSHNNYIELLFGGGIIGLILYYIPIISLLIQGVIKRNESACVLYMVAILVCKSIVEYAYVSYYERYDCYIMAILVGVVYSMKKGGNDEIEENNCEIEKNTFAINAKENKL